MVHQRWRCCIIMSWSCTWISLIATSFGSQTETWRDDIFWSLKYSLEVCRRKRKQQRVEIWRKLLLARGCSNGVLSLSAGFWSKSVNSLCMTITWYQHRHPGLVEPLKMFPSWSTSVFRDSRVVLYSPLTYLLSKSFVVRKFVRERIVTIATRAVPGNPCISRTLDISYWRTGSRGESARELRFSVVVLFNNRGEPKCSPTHVTIWSFVSMWIYLSIKKWVSMTCSQWEISRAVWITNKQSELAGLSMKCVSAAEVRSNYVENAETLLPKQCSKTSAP